MSNKWKAVQDNDTHTTTNQYEVVHDLLNHAIFSDFE